MFCQQCNICARAGVWDVAVFEGFGTKILPATQVNLERHSQVFDELTA
jgi:hypothetical protein